MNLKPKDIWLSAYWLDENIDVLHIKIDDDPSCFQVGEIEVPDTERYEILTKENENGKVGRVDIISPEEFMNSNYANQIQLNGENLKEFVLKALEEHSDE